MAWIGLAIALVALSSYPGLADPIRYTLILVILVTLLRYADRLAPQIDRFTRALAGYRVRGPGSPAFDAAHHSTAA